MSTPDDPRAFRRGQPSNAQYPAGDARGEDPRQPARQDPRNGAARPAYPRPEEQYPAFRDHSDGQDYPERAPAAGAASQRQPSFSAFRPEAYANGSEKPGGGRPDWPQTDSHFAPEPARPVSEKRAAPQAPRAAQPQPEPYRPQPAAPARAPAHHDPYHNAASDPYDVGRRDFDNTWQSQNYQETPTPQFAAQNYYQPHDEPTQTDAQSVHDRFFAAAPEPERAPPPPPAPPPAARYRAKDFAADDYGAEDRAPPPRAVRPAANEAANDGFEDAGANRWDNFDQTPAPESVRPFPQAKMAPEDDLDADYFADEDEFEGEEDYAEPKKSGSKKLMAAVLVGAVVTGGGLAYLYKAQTGGQGSEPLIVTADSRPIKETPNDPGGREFPNGGKLIYDRLDNAGGAGDEPTRVASGGESSSNNNVPGVTTTGASGTLEERIQNALRDAKKQDDGPAEASTSNTSGSYDEPRKVPTQIFRPDGSLEAPRGGGDSPRGVQRRQAPPPAVGETALASGISTRGVATREAAAAPAPTTRSAAPQQIAAIAPAAAISGGGDAGMFVQIAARNDEAAAMAAFADLRQKYASVLGVHSPSVRKVDLGDKGVWFRLLVGPMANKGDADKLCEDLKTAGMKGCFSRKE